MDSIKKTKSKPGWMKPTLVFITVALLGVPSANAMDYDTYVNDDGVTCSVMVDFEPLRGQLPKLVNEQQPFLMKHLAMAARTVQQGQCSHENSVEFAAIMVPKRDSYGQPHWGSVKYLSWYRGDLTKLQKLRPHEVKTDVLGSILKKINK